MGSLPKVILIGGAPMSGKTTLARKLAAQLEYACLSTDDLGEAIRAITSKGVRPELHPMAGCDYREYYIRHTVETLINHVEQQHLASWPAVEAVIRAHAGWAHPIVIEGWNLHPPWIERLNLSNVVSIWLLADERVLDRRIRAMEDFHRGASDPETMIQRFLQRSLWYGSRLRESLRQSKMASLTVTTDSTPETLCKQCLTLVAMPGGAPQ
jgi:2-phosphoglycerate kinase